MGGKKQSAPAAAPIAPPPTPDPNANADKTATSAPSFNSAQTEEAMKEQDKQKAGLGSTGRKGATPRDPAAIANQQSNALSSSAVITG